MIYRIFPTKDTCITNYVINGVAKTGSSLGSSEVLSVFKVAAISGATGAYSTSSLSRILTQFDLTQISSFTASNRVPSSDITYKLFMKNATHTYSLPYSYDIEVSALSKSWDEGRGHDVDSLKDKGFANWVKPTSTTYWLVQGGDRTGSISVQHFDNGEEDLYVNVTNIVNQWLSGNIQNNGFLVQLSSTQEQDSNDYYTKMFYSREVLNKTKLPFIECSWDDSIKDDRTFFTFNTTCSLYLYNSAQNVPTNLSLQSGRVYVRIEDVSGNLISIFTGSNVGIEGIYSASFAIPSSSLYSGSLFKDIWYSGSSVFMTGNFTPSKVNTSQFINNRNLLVNTTNLQNSYDINEFTRINFFIRDKDLNLSTLLTSSQSSDSIVAKKAYYRIDNDRTREVVIPFGTGSVETTRLSYDKFGNYFKLHVGSLFPGELYRVVLLLDIDGNKKYIDNNFKFKVY